MTTEPFRSRVVGRWGDVLPQCGIPVKFLNGKNQPCPLCGGKDRARFSNLEGNGTWICSKCGAGDGISLVMKKNGVDFKGAMAIIEPLIGAARVAKAKPARTDKQRRADLNALWKEGRHIAGDSPAGMFLAARTGITEYPDCLRSVDSMRCFADGVAIFHPGMIAKVSGPDGKPANVYRTYLTRDGKKAAVDPPRKMMPGPVPPGSAVRLFDHGEHLGVGEGIETCIAASLIHMVPVWATLGTSGLLSWVPPTGVTRVTVFGDNDKGFAGQAAAFALAHRLLALPNRPLDVDVKIPGVPDPSGDDWNDVLMRDYADCFPKKGDFE